MVVVLAWLSARPAEAGLVSYRIAVLEFLARDGAVPVADLQVLAGGARMAATQVVRDDTLVMTVETMLVLQSENPGKCTADLSCAVDVGRSLNATHVLSGTVSRFGGEMLLDLQFYDVLSGALLAAEQLRAADVGKLLDRVPSSTKGLIARSGFADPSSGFSFDAGGLASSVQSTAAAEAARQAELEAAARESACQKEAMEAADKRQADALVAARARAAGEVDAAWRGVCPVLRACLDVEDRTQRGACAAQATAFASRAALVEATVAAASFAIPTACGARPQVVGSRKGLADSPRVADARTYATVLAGALGAGTAPACPAVSR
jgi:TolB-like protein